MGNVSPSKIILDSEAEAESGGICLAAEELSRNSIQEDVDGEVKRKV